MRSASVEQITQSRMLHWGFNCVAGLLDMLKAMLFCLAKVSSFNAHQLQWSVLISTALFWVCTFYPLPGCPVNILHVINPLWSGIYGSLPEGLDPLSLGIVSLYWRTGQHKIIPPTCQASASKRWKSQRTGFLLTISFSASPVTF